MGKSMQEQLLKTGMATEQQVRQARADKRKQKKQLGTKQTVNESTLSVQQAAIAKAERDRLLNQQRSERQEHKAVSAQIKQLIENNKQLTGDEQIPYRFIDQNKVKTLYVSEIIREQLGCGRQAIVKLEQGYQVVPAEIAEKIRARSENRVILQNENKHETTAQDPYADYQVPDDLMW